MAVEWEVLYYHSSVITKSSQRVWVQGSMPSPCFNIEFARGMNLLNAFKICVRFRLRGLQAASWNVSAYLFFLCRICFEHLDCTEEKRVSGWNPLNRGFIDNEWTGSPPPKVTRLRPRFGSDPPIFLLMIDDIVQELLHLPDSHRVVHKIGIRNHSILDDPVIQRWRMVYSWKNLQTSSFQLEWMVSVVEYSIVKYAGSWPSSKSE